MSGAVDQQAILESWRAVRADADIQYAPLKLPPEPKPPAWLKWLQEFLADLFAPLARALGENWPLLKWGMIILAVALLALLLWKLLAPLAGWRPKPRAEEEEWAPDEGEALAMLQDADALAAEGRFDEATHLLLKRSVGQIRQARPDWLEPSSTAREIAALPMLPFAARKAFAVIAERVERSLFALRRLEAADWQAARAAYADFALNYRRAAPA